MPETTSTPLGILLITGTYERAHYALMLAAAAAAIGRPVTLFATNEGCRALLRDWSSLAGAANDAHTRHVGVAGFDELRDVAAELGIRLLACEAGLLLAGLRSDDLLDAAEVAGLPTFLAATGGATVITL